jgi:hypothetical protein
MLADQLENIYQTQKTDKKNCLFFRDLVSVNYFVSELASDLEIIVKKLSQIYKDRTIFKKFSFELEQEIENELKKIRQTKGKCILILEYPENSLFPIKQKKIPNYLGYLNQKYKIQIFVTTCSPFVIAGMMKLTEGRKRILDIPKKNFKPSQKVYFLNQGKILNKNGLHTFDNQGYCKGSDGYWGYKAGKLAMKILGLGLDDFLSNVEPEYSKDSPVLVFCEGKGKNNDAKIYNQIFDTYPIPILFVSSKSNSETLWSFELLAQVKNGLSGDFKILMLRDRDHDFPNLEDIFRLQKKHPNRRILYRRAIECYIYNSETAKLLGQKYDLKIPDKLLLQLDQINQQIEEEVKQKVLGNSYKKRLKTAFKPVYDFIVSHNKDNIKIPAFTDLQFLIAKEINSKTKVYQELEKVLFF